MYLSGGQACSKYRKTKDPKCEEQDGCQWIKGKGCTGRSKTKPAESSSVLRFVYNTASSRTWLGGVLYNEKFIETTPKKVKQAIQRLIGEEYRNDVKVEVKKHKNTKFFAIYLQWNEQLNEETAEEIAFQVDFYFEEDQHNQSGIIGDVFGYPNMNDGEVVLEVVQSKRKNRSMVIKAAEKQLKDFEQSAKKSTKPKMVCDGNKCRRVPAKKDKGSKAKPAGKKEKPSKKKPASKEEYNQQSAKMSANPMYKSVKTKGHGTTMRMVARTYAEEAGGEDGDICNIRPLLSKPDFRKLKISTDKKTGNPTYRWSKTTSTSDSCKVDPRDYL